jgi:hypothetical protein
LIALTIPALALLNRIRGGLLFPWIGNPPGRVGWYCAPLVFLTAWLVIPWMSALIFAGAWLVWSLPGWGQWYGLGRPIASGVPSKWEALVDNLCLGNDYAAFTLRNTVLVLPLALLSPWLVLLGPLQTVAYEIGWRIDRKAGSAYGELLTGALWGAALCAF